MTDTSQCRWLDLPLEMVRVWELCCRFSMLPLRGISGDAFIAASDA